MDPNTVAIATLVVATIGTVAACGAWAGSLLDDRVRLKLTAHLDQDANGDILRVSVTNDSVFEVRHKFVGMILKDGSEHLIREWWGSDPPPFQPRGQTWENHPFPLKFRAHESNRNGRIDFARDDLRYFVVRTAHGKKEYKAPIRT